MTVDADPAARRHAFAGVPFARLLGTRRECPEGGRASFVIESAIGLVAPKNLDPAIAARLHAAFKKALDDPEYRRMLDEFDLSPNYRSGPAYRAYAEAQPVKEKAMLDESGFRPE